MPKKPPVSDEDRRLFRETVGGVRPVTDRRAAPYRDRPAPVPRQSQLDDAEVMRETLEGWQDPATIETGEELLYSGQGVQHGVMRKLRRGQYAVEAEIDLHGMRVLEARAALAGFLRDCRRSRMRCVRVIHGKGYGSHGKPPVLKGMVNGWLRRRAEVLAFVSALPVHGGTGAIYVLLKKGTE